jgi:hypothetical protein
MSEPHFDPLYTPPPSRIGRRSILVWLVLLLVVIGSVAALLIWVTHRLNGIAQ